MCFTKYTKTQYTPLIMALMFRVWERTNSKAIKECAWVPSQTL